MTPTQTLGVALLLAVLLPLVILASLWSYLRFRYACWSNARMLKEIEDHAYRERTGTRPW